MSAQNGNLTVRYDRESEIWSKNKNADVIFFETYIENEMIY